MLEGIVLRIFNNLYEVHTKSVSIICHKKGSVPRLIVGDRVIVDERKDRKLIVERLDRKNAIKRPHLANIDKVLLLFSVIQPDYQWYQIDCFLVYFEYFGIDIELFFNKLDLVDSSNHRPLDLYQEIGYKVNYISALYMPEDEKKQLLKCLENQKIVLIGHSGAGKSTLINSLFPELRIRTREVSDKLKKGKQTTKQSALYPMDNTIYIGDTPGFSLAGFEDIPPEELSRCFPDFQQSVETCRFYNCRHLNEPGCQVKADVENGKIFSSRYESYVKMMTSLEKRKKW